MPEFLRRTFSGDGFMPHGHSDSWPPGVVWLHVLSDALIALSYFTIPVTLGSFVRRRRDLPFPFAFWAFGVFIVSGGTMHALEIWTLWNPIYWISGGVKAVTAAASIATAVLLVRLVPQALSIPSPATLRRARALVAAGEARFRAAAEGMTEAFYILDAVEDDGVVVDFRFVEINGAGVARIGRSRREIVGALYTKVYPEALSAGFVRRFAQVIATGIPYEGEDEVNDPAIDVRRVRLRVVPLARGVAITSEDVSERDRLERERALHVTIVDSMSDGVCLVKASDGVILYANPTFNKMLGYDGNELEGQPVAILNDARDAAEAKSIADRPIKQIRDEGPATYDVRNVCKDGRTITCRATSSLIHDNAQGDLIVAVQRDVTEQARIEQERDGFFRLSLDMLCIAGFDGRFKRLNPAWEEALGWSISELLATPWLDFVHPDDREATVSEGASISAGQKTLFFENRYRCKDGSYRTLSWHCAPSVENAIIYASVRDVTDFRAAEASLERSIVERTTLLVELHRHRQDEHLKVLAEAIPQIVWTANPDGYLDYYNQRWFDYTGMTLEQTQGWGWGPVLHPDDLQNCLDRWSHSAQTGDPYEVEYRFKRAADGQYRWHLGRALPVRDSDGKILKWFGTCTDIDDQRRAQDSLIHARQQLEDRVRERTAQLSSLNVALKESLGEKEVLLKEIHHRVKNNLQVISSLLKLQGEQVADPITRDLFNDSRARVRSIALLHEKLYQSKDLSRVDMAEYLRDLTNSLLRSYGPIASRVDLSTLAPGLVLGIDVAMPCGLIVNELVTNALKHAFQDKQDKPDTDRRGRVTVTMSQTGHTINLVVADDGCGFPPGLDLAGATTLGLHLVNTLCDQLEATVRFDNVRGTRCSIAFAAPSEGERPPGESR